MARDWLLAYTGMRRRQGRRYYRNVYLKTWHWKMVSRDTLRREPWCHYCGKRRSTDAHHTRYKVNGKSILHFEHLPENRRYVVGVCRVCHDRIEYEKRRNAWKKTWWGKLIMWAFEDMW